VRRTPVLLPKKNAAPASSYNIFRVADRGGGNFLDAHAFDLRCQENLHFTSCLPSTLIPRNTTPVHTTVDDLEYTRPRHRCRAFPPAVRLAFHFSRAPCNLAIQVELSLTVKALRMLGVPAWAVD